MKIADLRGGGKLKGPGTGTSDSIVGMSSAGPVKVSNNEFVIKAASTKKLGKPLLDYMNNHGKLPKRAGGGSLSQTFADRQKAYEEAKKELERQSGMRPVGTAPPAPPLPMKYDSYHEKPMPDREVQYGVQLPYTPSGERALIQFAVGGLIDPKLALKLKSHMANPLTFKYADPTGEKRAAAKAEAEFKKDAQPFKGGGLVKAGMKEKVLGMKNRGKVMAAMAQRRAGYKGGGEISTEYSSAGKTHAPKMKLATYENGGLLGGSLNPDNKRQYDEAGVEMPLKRTSTAPAVATDTSTLGAQDPSKVKVGLPPNPSIMDKVVTGARNMFRSEELRPFKKGGMVKKGLRC